MKKLIPVFLGCLLTATTALAGEPSAADQKWLEVVEKMIANGQTSVSTPSEQRATLLKDWAEKHNCTVKVTKTETSYSLQVSSKDASKSLAKN